MKQYIIGILIFLFCCGGCMHKASIKKNVADTFLDSVNKKRDSLGTFSSSNLIAKGVEKKRLVENKTGLFFVSVFLLSILGFIRFFFPKHLELLIRHTFSPSGGQRQIRELIESDRSANFWFGAIYFFSLSVLGCLSYAMFTHNSPFFNSVHIVEFLLIICALFLLRFLYLKLIAWVFRLESIINHVLFNTLVMNGLMSFVFLPLCIIAFFITPSLRTFFLNFVIIIGILSIFLKLLKNSMAVKNLQNISFLHFFIYLCASEILPVCLIFRIILYQQ